MAQTNRKTSTESTADIRIVSINTDKTRRLAGANSVYQIYFELSGPPPRAWRSIFQRRWKDLNPARPQVWQEAVIDRDLLVLHCVLPEVVAHLQVLKKTVAITNKTHDRYVQQQAAEEGRREDVCKQERRAVDEMAELLEF